MMRKQKEQRVSLDRTYDGFLMTGKQINKEETYIKLRILSQWWETKGTNIKHKLKLRLCPIVQKLNEQTIKDN